MIVPVLLASLMCVVSPDVSFESLLHEMTERTALARFPEPAYTCAQSSSFDRAATSPDRADTWFANNDANQFLRVDQVGGRKEWVLLDQPGPGAVVRIWSANPKGVMRVYVDGHTQPLIEAPMAELLSGKHPLVGEPLAHEAARGFNLYLPLPYAKHCKITCDQDGFYYHVNYRTYEASAQVHSLTTASLAKAAGTIRAVNDTLKTTPIDMPEESPLMSLASGSSFTVPLPLGPNALHNLRVRLQAENLEQATRSTVLIGSFDDIETIWCPLGDFFGSGVGANTYHDLFRAVNESGTFVSRWAMPYETNATLKIVNLGKQPVRVGVQTQTASWEWDDRSMHFYARWNAEYPIHTKGGAGTKDFNYLSAEGRGVLVGDNLSIMNPVADWWGEGDEKIWIDRESFPSHFGTGTEDYYGYAWCAPIRFVNPFHSQPRVDGQKRQNNHGYSTVTRVRALDAIPFTQSIRFDMEVWHWKECDVAYASTVYFYARPGLTHNRPADLASASAILPAVPPLPPPFVIENARECEELTIVDQTDGLNVVQQRMDSFKPRTWSGETQLWVQGQRLGDYVELKVPCLPGERVRVAVHATKSWDYGIVRFSVDGQTVETDHDFFSGAIGTIQATGAIDLGEHRPIGNSLRLRAEVVGHNPQSQGSQAFFGLDCVVLTPVE